MISDCVYCGWLELNEVSFFQDVANLLVLVGPGALTYTLWRILVTNKTGLVVLGLDRGTDLHDGLTPRRIPTAVRVLYLVSGGITFTIGLLVSGFWNS
jgi:hypothetical protein